MNWNSCKEYTYWFSWVLMVPCYYSTVSVKQPYALWFNSWYIYSGGWLMFLNKSSYDEVVKCDRWPRADLMKGLLMVYDPVSSEPNTVPNWGSGDGPATGIPVAPVGAMYPAAVDWKKFVKWLHALIHGMHKQGMLIGCLWLHYILSACMHWQLTALLTYWCTWLCELLVCNWVCSSCYNSECSVSVKSENAWVLQPALMK